MAAPRFAPYFTEWHEPWTFADAETTAARLNRSGFADVTTGLEHTPVVLADATAFREFVSTVICRPHLAHLPEPELREQFIDTLASAAAIDVPAFELDYWRLNIDATRPATS
jgi:hypothetical protein